MELRRPISGGTSFLTYWIFLLQMLGSARRGAEGHGRLMDPPARNSMWRFGFPNPVNYNDNELFCGGYAEPNGLFRSDGKRLNGMSLVPWKMGRPLVWDATCVDTLAPSHLQETSIEAGGAAAAAENLKRLKYNNLDGVQWEQNEGKCGVCGDAHHISEPRPHEAGGMYGKGIVTRHYSVGQEIEVEVELTANHLGTFVMKLCPNNNPKQEASQECFDRYPLYVAETREDRFLIPLDTAKKEIFRYRVRLPPYITCTQCVLQWTYYTGNMWGVCPNGTEAVGCGRSETFRNCADVSVITSTGGLPPAFAGDLRRDNPFLLYYRDLYMPKNVYPLVVSNDIETESVEDSVPQIIRNQVCVPTPAFRSLPGMLRWCQTNCLRYPPHCPEDLCTCPQVCESVGELKGREGADVYCMDQCIVYPPRCPANRCSCY